VSCLATLQSGSYSVAGLDISKIIANVKFHNANINEIIDNFKSENADNKTQPKLHPKQIRGGHP